jgi:hypothetical protein
MPTLRPIRLAFRIAAGSSLALGLAGATSLSGQAGMAPAGAVDAVCSPTSSTSGTTTTLTFSDVGSCTWTPPGGVTAFTVTLWGAAGGAASSLNPQQSNVRLGSGDTPHAGLIPNVAGTDGAGGEGAEVTGTVSVTAGTELEFNVGGTGTASGDSGGGAGSGGGGNGEFFSGGGGGASDLRAGSFASTDRVLVAGGGGGGGSTELAATGGAGGNADTAGTAGADVNGTIEGSSLGGGGGGGAGEIGTGNGGAAGVQSGAEGCNPLSFAGNTGTSDGTGGDGSTSGADSEGGGGGGGGFFGGGGGGTGAFENASGCPANAGDGGGGGGSSYVDGADGIVPTGTSVQDPASPNAPNGEMQVSYTAAVAPVTTATTVPAATSVAANPTGAVLAVTGVDVLPLLAIGGGLMAGGVLILSARAAALRRKRVPARS